MQAWLYQMRSRDGWRPEDYRLKVWEGTAVDWPIGKTTGRGKSMAQGDLLVFFFTRAGTEDPGIYGWGW